MSSAIVKLVAAVVQRLVQDPQFLAGRLAYYGVFRGFVEDVVDPEQRGRVRVRVPHANHNAPTSMLPWAERSLPDAGPDCGLFIPLRAGVYESKTETLPTGERRTFREHTGDAVWVMFEGGDPDNPVVLGLWHSAPGGEGESPERSKAARGHNRRLVWRTRHGTTLEFGDERSDFEVKISMPGGNIVHMREANGGRGIHINTGGGHKISLQDEHPGQSATPPLNDYDRKPDATWVATGPATGVFAGERREVIAPTPDKAADGVVKTGTEQPAVGFGQKGVSIETSGGHEIHLRDVTDPGALIRTNDGHLVEILDAPNEIHVRTVGGQRVDLLDGASKVYVFANTQVHIESGATVHVEAPDTITIEAGDIVNINAGSLINMSAPVISIDADDSYVHADGAGNLAIGARGIDFEKVL